MDSFKSWVKITLLPVLLVLLVLSVFTQIRPIEAQSVTFSASVSDTVINFRGFSSPNSVITFKENGIIIGNSLTDATGAYNKSFTAVTPGIRIINVFSTDRRNTSTPQSQKSILAIPFQSIELTVDFPPTLYLSGDYQNGNSQNTKTLTIAGFGKPNSEITINLGGPSSASYQVRSDANGSFQRSINTGAMINGDYLLTAYLNSSGGSYKSTPLGFRLSLDRNVQLVSGDNPPAPQGTGCEFTLKKLCFFNYTKLDLDVHFSKFFNKFVIVNDTRVTADSDNWDINSDRIIDDADLSIVLANTYQSSSFSGLVNASGQRSVLSIQTTDVNTDYIARNSMVRAIIWLIVILLLISLIFSFRDLLRRKIKRLLILVLVWTSIFVRIILVIILIGFISSTGYLGLTEPASTTNNYRTGIINDSNHNTFSVSLPSAADIGSESGFIKLEMLNLAQPVNVIAVELNFDPNQIEIIDIDTTGSVMNIFAKKSFSNTDGTISLMAGITHPGFLAEVGHLIKVNYKLKVDNGDRFGLRFASPPRIRANDGIASNIIKGYFIRVTGEQAKN